MLCLRFGQQVGLKHRAVLTRLPASPGSPLSPFCPPEGPYNHIKTQVNNMVLLDRITGAVKDNSTCLQPPQFLFLYCLSNSF